MTVESPSPDRTGPPVAPTAVALGMLGLLLVFPPGLTPTAFATGVVLVAVVFGGVLVRTRSPYRAVRWFFGLFLVGCVVAVGALRVGGSIWLAALALAIALGTLSYALHRYELVSLGLVGDGQG